MKISTKGRYALRLMLDLASNDSGTPIRLKDVAKRQGISEKYLEQIISILNNAISSVVDHVSLEELLSWQNARADDYVI